MATKMVPVVEMTFVYPPTGQLMVVDFNADDGALATYSGPGEGWELAGSETIMQEQMDYGDEATFDALYPDVIGTPTYDAAVHQSGELHPPSMESPTILATSLVLPLGPEAPYVRPGAYTRPIVVPPDKTGEGWASAAPPLDSNAGLMLGGLAVLAWLLS